MWPKFCKIVIVFVPKTVSVHCLLLSLVLCILQLSWVYLLIDVTVYSQDKQIY